MATVIFPVFEPDKNRFNEGATPEMRNVVPVSDGWTPLSSPNPATPLLGFLTDEYGNPLTDGLTGDFIVTGPDGDPISGDITIPDACVGAFFARTDDGSSRAFFATATKIYEYDFTGKTFTDISGSSAPYAVNGRVSFEQFGSKVYAQNGVDPEQVIDVEIGTVFEDNSTAPISAYLKTVGDFLVRARLTDDQSAIQWSALNDPTSNDAGLQGSDRQYFPEGNGISGIVSTSYGAVIFCRDTIYQMSFALTSEFVFTFSPLTKLRGAIAPYAICSIGQDDFVFYAADGFYRGAAMSPIGAERVNRWFRAQTTEGSRLAMTSAADYRNNTVWFRYQDALGAYKCLGYQWQLDKWVPPSDMDLVEMLRAATPAVTIDGLSDLYGSIDAMDITFDSSSLDGGSAELGGITSDGYFAFLNGEPMAAVLATNELLLGGGRNVTINGGRLLGDAINHAVTVTTTEYAGGPTRTRSAVRPTARTKSLGILADGRTHKLRLDIDAGETWTIVNGLEIDTFGTGKS